MKIRARNVLPGTVVALTKGPVSTEVTLEIAPGLTIVSTNPPILPSSFNLPSGHRHLV